MRPPQGSRTARIAARLGAAVYRLLLLAYPPSFRAEHGDDAVRVFAEACRESWVTRGAWAVGARWVHAIAHVPRDGVSERYASRPAHSAFAGRLGPPLDLWGDFRYAARSIVRRPTLAAGVIITLALGLGSNTAMFSVVNATLLRPLPYRDADRVVYIRSGSVEINRLSDPALEDLERWAPLLTSLERVEARTWRSVLLTGDEGATRIRMLEVSAGYLAAVGSRRIAGRQLQPADRRPEAPPVVVISERLWRSRYGGRPDMVGRTIEIDSSPRVVVGVTSDVLSDTPGLRFAIFAPLPSADIAGPGTTALGIGWLKPDVSIEVARAELQAISASVDERGHRVTGMLEPPTNIFWEAGELRDPQLALMAGVVLLLLIACVNVAMLLLGAGESRAQELATRIALGATRWRLVRLLLFESLLLAFAGGAVGLLLGSYAVQFFARMDPGIQLQTQLEAIRLDVVVVSYSLGFALMTAAACGIIPAFRASAAAPRSSVLGSGRTATAQRRWPQAFVAVEIAASLVLLVAAGLVGRAFLEMHLADPGFPADRILGVRIALPHDRYPTPDRRSAFFDEVLMRAARLPGVTAVGLGYGAMPPTDFLALGAIETDGARKLEEDVGIWVSYVSPGHFALMGIPLLAGTGFGPRDIEADERLETPVIIGDSLRRRFWPDRYPLGESFQLTDRRGTRKYRILGIAGDVRGRGLLSGRERKDEWQMYLPLSNGRQYTEVLLRIADGAPPPAAALRAALIAIDPSVPADDSLETASASLQGYLARPRFRAALFGGFATLAVVLVAFGLLAVVYRSVKRRTREIGIRLALGAQPSRVRREILTQALQPAAAGLTAGLLLSFLLTRTLRSFLHGVSPTDGLVFVASTGLLATVAVMAILGPVFHATRVDPAQVLRSE